MNAETYAVTSYKEVLEAKKKKDKANFDFLWKYKNYLITCLCNAGLVKVIVRNKNTNDKGVPRVEENKGSLLYPYEIKFYPIRKDGGVSLKAKYIPNFWQYKTAEIFTSLQNSFESTGDNYAG